MGKGKDFIEMTETPELVNTIAAFGDEKIQDIGASYRNTIVATKRRIFVCGDASKRIIGRNVFNFLNLKTQKSPLKY